jgi:ADP-ribose pyrophosphatase YjhB (NUDIX family)
VSDEGRGPRKREIPPGDTRFRLVCPECKYIVYENPKVLVGSVCTWGEKLLLCKRAINPRAGFWTLPAGFLEMNESPIEGAMREAYEEAYAKIAIDALLAVYTIRRPSQIQLMYRARLVSPDVKAGEESADVRMFAWDELPWSELAFPSVKWALTHFKDLKGETVFAPRTNPPGATGNLDDRF